MKINVNMKRALMIAAFALAVTSPALAEEQAGHDGGDHAKAKHHMMQKLDADDDGMVSKAEMMAFHEKRFDEADTNDDGMLSKEEMEAQAEAMKAKWQERREKRQEQREEQHQDHEAAE